MIPLQGRVMGALAAFSDLAAAHRIVEAVAGFDHRPLADLQRSADGGDPLSPLPLPPRTIRRCLAWWTFCCTLGATPKSNTIIRCQKFSFAGIKPEDRNSQCT